MSFKHLDSLFKPKSVAVIGASNASNRPGFAVMRNLLQGHFDGPIMPVTPDYKSVQGVLAYRSIEELPITPDLAIICTRASRVPAIIMQLGRKGTGCAIVIASGLENLHTAQGTNLQEQMKQIAAHWNIRLLGPNSLGFIAPALGLSASYAHTQAQPGKIAFLSQSSAMCTALLDWSKRRRIGFSYVVSLGDAVDIDFDELIDYLGRDPATTAILLYIDSISDGRAFLSAARAASFNKPLLVIKAGGHLDSAQLFQHGSTTPLGIDAVYDAAFRRAGMLRVGDLRELMAAVETLANGKPIRGEKLVIVSNGNGPSAMAVDTLLQRGGKLEQLNEELVSDIKKILRPGSRATNPIHLLGDATPEEYTKVLIQLLNDKAIENILLMHAPSALVPAEVYAQAVIETYQKRTGRKPNLLVNWMGEEAAQTARYLFADANIASFRTPEGAIIAFMHMVDYRRNQKLLSETPESVMEEIPHHPQLAIQLHQESRHEKFQESINQLLSPENTKRFLAAYGLRVEKSLHTHATPLRIQVAIDPIFGPFIALGEPVSGWRLESDAAIALPPLNMALSRYLILQALGKGKIRERDGAETLDQHQLARLLTCVSQMVVDNPQITELLLNPVWIKGKDIHVENVAVTLSTDATQSLAICPYPKELEEDVVLRNGRKVLFRPIRPEDESTHKEFDLAMSKEDRYKRYFAELPHFSHEQLAHQTQIDYNREMAFIATAKNENGDFYTLGVVRAIFAVDGLEAEFAMAVRSDEKSQGLGTLLLEKMIRYCKTKNLQRLTGVTMLENAGMANLARKLGFTVKFDRDEDVVHMELKF